MKYAIVEIGGHQAWVEEGKYFLSNRISKDQGTNLLFNRILLVKRNEDSFFGNPHLKNSHIYAKILTEQIIYYDSKYHLHLKEQCNRRNKT